MEELLKIAKEEAAKHDTDIEAAVDATLARASKTKWFAALAKDLIRRAVREFVHDQRHLVNIALRKEHGHYGGPAKVVPGEAVANVCRSLYSYMIAGRTLGVIRGEELGAIADTEAATAEGHMFNAKLARALMPLVSAEKTVRQCVAEKKLRKLFEELG